MKNKLATYIHAFLIYTRCCYPVQAISPFFFWYWDVLGFLTSTITGIATWYLLKLPLSFLAESVTSLSLVDFDFYQLSFYFRHTLVFAFAWNAKSSAIAILVFLFFFLVTFSGWTTKNYQKARDENLTHSLDTLKNIPIKIFPQVVVCDVYGTWHGLCTVTNIHSVQKSTRNSQKLGNKLSS